VFTPVWLARAKLPRSSTNRVQGLAPPTGCVCLRHWPPAARPKTAFSIENVTRAASDNRYETVLLDAVAMLGPEGAAVKPLGEILRRVSLSALTATLSFVELHAAVAGSFAGSPINAAAHR
jgi:hypothetical protein